MRKIPYNVFTAVSLIKPKQNKRTLPDLKNRIVYQTKP